MKRAVCVKKALVSMAAMALMATPFVSYAGDGSLDKWIAKSNALVDQHMSYPHYAQRNEHTGDVYIRVTIDEDGSIVNHQLVEKSGSKLLDKASVRMLEKIGQFPAVPYSHAGDQMTFGVSLHYDLAYSAADYRNKIKRTIVRMQEIRQAQGDEIVLAAKR